MLNKLVKIVAVSALSAAVGGCATQPGRPGGVGNPFCLLAGAAVAGGGTAALTAAAGPIGAGVMVGAMLGSLVCHTETPPAETVVAAAPPPPPEPVAVVDGDSDGDGVPDSIDRCPGTAPGMAVDADGCPAILLTLKGVNFKFDSSAIGTGSEAILDQAIKSLNESSSVDVRITGHTDSTGSDAYNQRLSERRAAAVRDYLIAHGIPAARLTIEGRGEGQPAQSNATAEGRYENRRIEFHVAKPKT
jgi:outer membrane protein OmpA-like peptidoglycan-associated protein